MRALIVDHGRDRSSLVAARMLHADGWQVGTAAWRRSTVSHSSLCGPHHTIATAEGDEDRFIADIAAAVAEQGYGLVFCAYDDGVLALSRRRAEIGPEEVVPYAPHEVVERAFDKLAFTRAAEAAGLGVPHTVEATPEALAAWRGPVVVKARLHVPHRYRTCRFERAADAAGFVEQLRAEGAAPLLQERITGALGAVVVVAGRDGRVVAEIHQRCDRSWPPEAGVTARARTIAVDPDLSARVAELVRALGWFGLAEIEYLLDEDGRPRFTELNGRFYGGMALAGRAGVPVAAIWARLASGRSLGPVPQARVGARFQWLNRDIAASRAAAGLPGVAAALALAPLSAHSMVARGDAGPLLRFYLPEMARRAASRAGIRRGHE